MKPDSPNDDFEHEFPDALPPEIHRALSRLRDDCPAAIEPATDAAILKAARQRMAEIRARKIAPFPRWALWPLAAAACILLAFLVKRPPATAPETAMEPQDEAAIIFREVSALYPNQVKAITRGRDGLQLTLADEPVAESGKPLVLRVCENSACEDIITFSGQQITVAGHDVTVRTSSDGRVTLQGDELLWNSDSRESSLPGVLIVSRYL
jgi:hypothetical protein